MRLLPLLLLASFGPAAVAQNAIHTFSVGNWRNGPTVHIGPVLETTEAFTTPQLIAQLKALCPEFAPLHEIDVLRFATIEEALEHRAGLQAKYRQRKLDVNMVEAPSAPGE